MKPINKEAQKIMEKLTEDMNRDNRYRVCSAGSPGFMDVVVELINVEGYNRYPQFSVAHYYKMNGDLMRDPEMIFIKLEDGRFYPIYYRQDNLGIEQFSVELEQAVPVRFFPRLQKDHAVFAGIWMKNIKHQQKL